MKTNRSGLLSRAAVLSVAGSYRGFRTSVSGSSAIPRIGRIDAHEPSLTSSAPSIM